MKTEQHMIEKGGIREPGWHLIDLSRFHENLSSATIREACSKDVNLDKIIQRAARLRRPEVKPTNRVKQQEQETGSCEEATRMVSNQSVTSSVAFREVSDVPLTTCKFAAQLNPHLHHL